MTWLTPGAVQAGMQDVDLKWIGVVMLGPPNNGSGLAQTLSKVWQLRPPQHSILPAV